MVEGKEENEKAEKASWIKMKASELENIVKELAQKGNSPAMIGIILRDKYGVPKARLLGKRITKILKELKVNYNSEKEIVSEKVDKLKMHIGKNKHDKNALRSLAKKIWFLQRIEKQN